MIAAFPLAPASLKAWRRGGVRNQEAVARDRAANTRQHKRAGAFIVAALGRRMREAASCRNGAATSAQHRARVALSKEARMSRPKHV
jgi:hypothetical protein